MNENNEITKKVNITSIFAIIFLLAIVAGASFAYFGSFSTKVNNKASVNVNTGSGISSSFVSTTAPLDLHATLANMINASAGDVVADSNSNLNVTLTLGTASSTYSCTYDIVFEYDIDSKVYGDTETPVTNPSSKELTLIIKGANVGTNNYSTEKNFAYDSSWSAKSGNVGYKKVVVKDAIIKDLNGTGTTQSWNINLKFYILSESQASIQGKSFSGNFYVENIRCKDNK